MPLWLYELQRKLWVKYYTILSSYYFNLSIKLEKKYGVCSSAFTKEAQEALAKVLLSECTPSNKCARTWSPSLEPSPKALAFEANLRKEKHESGLSDEEREKLMNKVSKIIPLSEEEILKREQAKREINELYSGYEG